MKKTLSFLFIIISVMAVFPHTSHAQELLPRPIVRIVYFLPRDRQPQPNIDVKLDALIKDVQQYFANLMETQGFGRKTFQIETDAKGKVVVHRVRGKFTEAYYHTPQEEKAVQEIAEQFDTSKNIYLTILEISSKETCRGIGYPLIPASGTCFEPNITAHELLHAFGWAHDFRSYDKVFSCLAEWLDVHRAFNPPQSAVDEYATVKMYPPSLAAPPNAIRLRFEVTDPDGLHQVQLLSQEIGHSGGVLSCKRLNGESHRTVEFVTTNLIPKTEFVYLQAIDVHGNISQSKVFPIDITPLLPRPKVVSIPDANLAAAVQEQIGNRITTYTIENLTGLDVPNRGIVDLTGLEHAHNLRTLNLGGEYVAGEGYVNSNAISNFSLFKGLSKLTYLNLSNNAISDVSFLSGLTELWYLDLSNNAISDVSPLAGLTQLHTLYLSFNAISDVSPLAGLTQLGDLGLSWNTISDVSPLARLTQLTRLALLRNAISDVSPLAGLTQLRHLNLWDNIISDVSSLAGFTQLTQLYLGNNIISNVAPLAGLTQLTYLDIKDNTISNVAPLAGLTQLTRLDLSFNAISDVSALAGLTHLAQLKLRGNAISDVSSLVPLNIVRRPWTDWVDLEKVGLYLEGNPLSYTSLHTHIPAMQAKGVEVEFTSRTPTTLTKILGDAQQTQPGKTLATPFIVAVKDEKGVPFAGVPITFTVTAGGGKVRPAKPVSDTTGRAQTTLTLGATLVTNTVRVTATEIQQPVIFTTTTTLTDNRPPTFSKPLTFSVAENTTAVGTVKATDVDTQDLVTGYIINPTAGEDSAKFSISATGVLRFKTPPDYERPTTASRNNEYIVLVSAISGTGERMRTGTQLFTIIVTDVDEPPAAPSAPAVTAATPTSLIVTWAAPTNTGPSMIYQVRYRVGNTVKFTDANYNDTLTSFTLNNLRHGKRYQVQVRAKNSEGTSVWSPSGIGIPQTSPLITFPDAGLQAKVTEALGKARNATVTAVDMLALTRLQAPNANIQNLAGLEHAHNLTSLDLGFEYISGDGLVNSNTIADFSPLSGLTQLTTLALSGGSLSDVSFLSDMTQLKLLQLFDNTISDVSALSGLTQLQILSLSQNTISDISALSGLTQLQRLNLSNNSISDVSPLAKLTQLTFLSLWDNSISDISALSGLTQLTELTLRSNNISDVSALSGLTQLTVLDLYINTISDVSSLIGLDLTGAEGRAGLNVKRNPLNYTSVHTHIPAMQAKGSVVLFDNRAYSALVKISGDTQEGEVRTTLITPLGVQALDPHGSPITGLSVTFYVIEGGGSLNEITVTTDAQGRARTTLTLGPDPGVHKVRASSAQVTYPATFTAIATDINGDGTEAAQLATDVNGDGAVNVEDLVLIFANLGQMGQNRADVNGDQVVDAADFLLVADAIEADAAAPALHLSAIKGLTAAEVQRLLTQAHDLALIDRRYLRGIMVLEQLLASLISKETALLANYPNPFNPETWIPYQLAKPAEVTLHIYSVKGELVRTLALGHQPAGMYHTKSHAAYWDGRNLEGEPVASGIYFYTLSAGDFTATRKMLIRK